MRKFCGNAAVLYFHKMHFVEIQLLQFYAIRPKLYGNCAFLKKFYTRELDKNAVFFAVTVNNVQKCKDNNSARILQCSSVPVSLERLILYLFILYGYRTQYPFWIFLFRGDNFTFQNLQTWILFMGVHIVPLP